MSDYIRRGDAIKLLRGSAVAKYPASFSFGLFAAADEISKMPAAAVAPVVHGEWDKNADDDNIVYCDQCLMPQDMPTNYCSCCGARMDGES
ncbi:MAG: hypothetical protein IIV05_01530 [Ruminococcus sp.]|nr:hypothetical protein [Ruminococcus sp.]